MPEAVLGGVGTALAVFAWPKEEESGNPGKVTDSDVSCGGYLGGGVQGLDNSDKESPHSCCRRILFLIGRQLASQTKVEFPHAIMTVVVGPHG